MIVVSFVLVAAIATLARAIATAAQPVDAIAWRTLAVNIGGALALGFVITSQPWDNPMVITIAGLGSLTTFSTVAAETASLLDNGRKPLAIAYVGLTVVVGIAAAWLGLIIGDLV